jgi:hypothetical protein
MKPPPTGSLEVAVHDKIIAARGEARFVCDDEAGSHE